MENVINSYSLPLLTVAGLSMISSDSGESLGSLFEGLTFQWLHEKRPLQCEEINTFRTEINWRLSLWPYPLKFIVQTAKQKHFHLKRARRNFCIDITTPIYIEWHRREIIHPLSRAAMPVTNLLLPWFRTCWLYSCCLQRTQREVTQGRVPWRWKICTWLPALGSLRCHTYEPRVWWHVLGAVEETRALRNSITFRHMREGW